MNTLAYDQTEINQSQPGRLFRKHDQTALCFDCKTDAPIDGYRFKLVPICGCCRTKREMEITGNRFERRDAGRRG